MTNLSKKGCCEFCGPVNLTDGVCVRCPCHAPESVSPEEDTCPHGGANHDECPICHAPEPVSRAKVRVSVPRHEIENIARAYDFDKKNNRPPALSAVEVEATLVSPIKITPSSRIDYCGDCKTEHGYECPKDEVIIHDLNRAERVFGTPPTGEKEGWERPLFSVDWYKGEMDFGVNGKICELTYEQMSEFRQMLVVAIGTAETMWRNRRDEEARTPKNGKEGDMV